jgi:hypothetical protein
MSIVAPSALTFGAEDTPSPARLNRVTFHVGTGTELQNLSPKYPGMPVFCILDGAGLIGGAAYIRAPDNQSWIPLGVSQHTHNADTDASGGRFANVVFDNLENIFWISKPIPKATNFITTTSGGTVTDNAAKGAVTLFTTATAGNYADCLDYGVNFSYASKLKMIVKMYVDAGTYVTCKVGSGMEHIASANDISRKIGYEVCDTVGSTRNWEVTSSDGAIRSTSTSQAAVSKQTAHAYKVLFTPFQSVQFYEDGTLSITKTTNIPNSGNSNETNIFRAGIKTNNGTGKNLFLFGYVMTGQNAPAASGGIA